MTSVPEYQKDHALTMVRFAVSCVAKLGTLLIDMADDYGDETNSLALRVGIHTGPVTAGVLRGERSRFQLFGDTVNTASRMESLGKPGKIHLSTACATELCRAGYEEWLTKRDDQVFAKGKGKMETYFACTQHLACTATTGPGTLAKSEHSTESE